MSDEDRNETKANIGAIGLGVIVTLAFAIFVAAVLGREIVELEDRIQVLEGIHAEQIIEELADQ